MYMAFVVFVYPYMCIFIELLHVFANFTFFMISIKDK